VIKSKIKKTKTVSFRIPESIMSEIERDAQSQLVSTNILINQVLHHYVVWERYRQKLKIYPVGIEVITELLDNLNDSEISEAADLIYDSVRDYSLVMKKKFDLTSCIECIKTYCNLFGICYEDSSGNQVFSLRHGMGKKFSLILVKLFEKIFWDLEKVRTDSQITNSCVVIKPKSNII